MIHKIKILIADDHNILRQSLVALLSKRKNFDIVGEAANGKKAIELAKKLKPDVILMDVTMPIIDGIEATKSILEHDHSMKIIALTVHDEEGYILEIINSGAKGYLLKNTTSDELIDAIEKVESGASYFSREVSQTVIDHYKKKIENYEKFEALNITSREKEVLKLIGNGLSNKEIADQISLSIRTIEAYRDSIKKKLDINSTAGLIKYAIRIGLSDK